VNKKGLWLGLLLVLLMLWPVSAAFADEPSIYLDDGRIFVDEDVSLESGEVFDGDLGVFDGDLSMSAGSIVTGDVFVTSGDAEISGRINGDLAVISGDLHLSESGAVDGEVFVMSGDAEIAGRVDHDLSVMFGDMELRHSAFVGGDLMIMAGDLEREEGAHVGGDAVSEIVLPELPIIPERPDMPELPEMPEMPELPEVPEIHEWEPPTPPMHARPHRPTLGQRVGSFVGRTMTAAFLSMIFIGVGILVVFVWPRHTQKVAECISAMPLQSFGLGLLTFLMAAVLEAMAMVLMIIIILIAAALISTVILIPIGLLLILLSVLVLLPVPLALAGAVVLGWVSLAQVVGRKVIKLLNAGYVKPLGATLVGLLVTVPLAAIFWVIKPACCAWPFIILLTSVGVGAAIHTRFGTQNCQNGKPVPPAEALPAEAMDEEDGEPDEPPPTTP